MRPQQWILHVEPQAPAKPAWGAPCNGCGICCLVAPCPLGMLVSRRRRGACAALQWEPEAGRYRCGLMQGAQPLLRHWLPGPLSWLAPGLASILQGLAPRWIAAGTGCDSDLQAEAWTMQPAAAADRAPAAPHLPSPPP